MEKNGGCNLVVCKCRQPFCWLCGQSTGLTHTWERIEGHECGRFKAETDARVGEAARNHKCGPAGRGCGPAPPPSPPAATAQNLFHP